MWIGDLQCDDFEHLVDTHCYIKENSNNIY